MNKKLEKIDFFENVFNRMVERYQIILENYYPAFQSNGFTERNLTFNFCNSYFELSSNFNDDVLIWQEVPIKNLNSNKLNNHIDSLIIDINKKILIFIEAKRIRNIKTYNLLKEDISRVLKNQNIPPFEDISLFEKYGLFLTDIWTSKAKKDKRKDIKIQMEQDFNRDCTLVYNPDNIDYEDYYINYKIIKL